jgi:hypothetical protein
MINIFVSCVPEYKLERETGDPCTELFTCPSGPKQDAKETKKEVTW